MLHKIFVSLTIRFKLPRCDPKKWVTKKLPILKWLPKYNKDMAISDFIAGITVGLMVIPQGIAYALIANLPAQVT
jgi:sodium-independent sulfate anion transporter 11